MKQTALDSLKARLKQTGVEYTEMPLRKPLDGVSHGSVVTREATRLIGTSLHIGGLIYKFAENGEFIGFAGSKDG